MNNTSNEEIRECLPFGDGSLVLQKRVKLSEEYGPLPVLESKTLYYRIPSGETMPVNRISDIQVIAHHFYIDIDQAFSNAPVALASLIADYEELGTVLVPCWRHKVFQERYGIDLESNRPRLEGSNFRFLVVNLDITHTPHTVTDITVNLVNMQLLTRDVMDI